MDIKITSKALERETDWLSLSVTAKRAWKGVYFSFRSSYNKKQKNCRSGKRYGDSP